jgi:hypothetical protein
MAEKPFDFRFAVLGSHLPAANCEPEIWRFFIMYERYGDEWKKEMSKLRKDEIIDMFRIVAIERDKLADKKCPECGSDIVTCMMGHYCGEVLKSKAVES